jgi:hypothetical protein
LLHGLSVRRYWLLLALLPVFAYLAAAATIPDRFRVEQKIAIGADVPVAVEDSPVDFVRLGELTAHPESFFRGDFSIMELSRHLEGYPQGRGLYRESGDLRALVATAMSLQLSPDNSAQVVYDGKDRALGEQLVAFYARQLMSRADEGFKRKHRQEARGTQASAPVSGPEPAQQVRPAAAVGPAGPAAANPIQLTGQAQVKELRAAFRPERFAVAAWILAVSLVLVLALIVVREWTDPSFKSERQVARYLNLKILGSLPNLDKVPLRRDHPL